MDNQPDDTSGSTPSNAPGSIAAQPFSVGAKLRETRMHLGLEVADVADHIKFAPRQIEALEEDNLACLPEMAFVRGFVRSYAKLLQLDPAPLLAALPGISVQSAPSIVNILEEVPFPNVYSAHKSNIIWLAAALAVAVILVLFAWLHGSTPKAPQVETQALPVALPASAVPDAEIVPQIAAPIVQQAAVPSAKPAAASGAHKRPDTIRLTFDEESWVEVKDKNGDALLSQINSRGSEQSINGNPPFSVVIGRASNVHLYYKGQAVDLKPYTKAEIARLTLE